MRLGSGSGIAARHKAGPNATSDTGGRPGYGGSGCDEGVCYTFSKGGYFYRTKESLHWYTWARWVLMAGVLVLFFAIVACCLWGRKVRRESRTRQYPNGTLPEAPPPGHQQYNIGAVPSPNEPKS